jgi:hypothetical protein
MHIRIPGQRWFHLVCFGRLGHYYEDGACEHTDALLAEMTPYGKQVTKGSPLAMARSARNGRVRGHNPRRTEHGDQRQL